MENSINLEILKLKGELVADLIKAKIKFPPIRKNKKVSAGKFSYDYASFEEILEAIEEPLAEHNLEVGIDMGFHENGSEIVICTLKHTNGLERISKCYLNPASNDHKEMGISFSYKGRYLLAKMLGLKITEPEDHEDYVPEKKDKDMPKEAKNTVVIDSSPRISPEILESLKKRPEHSIRKILSFNQINRLEDLTMNQYRNLVERQKNDNKQ